jgi:hypothetical protein
MPKTTDNMISKADMDFIYHEAIYQFNTFDCPSFMQELKYVMDDFIAEYDPDPTMTSIRLIQYRELGVENDTISYTTEAHSNIHKCFQEFFDTGIDRRIDKIEIHTRRM